MDARIFAFLALVAGAFCLISPGYGDCPEWAPDPVGERCLSRHHTFKIESAEGNPFDGVELTVRIDANPDALPEIPGVEGWELALCHNSEELEIMEARKSQELLDLEPVYNEIEVHSDGPHAGVTHGVVFTILGSKVLPPSSDFPILGVVYRLVGDPGTWSDVYFCPDGALPLDQMVSIEGRSYVPETIVGRIGIRASFLRGDVNDDGKLGLPDAQAILYYIFNTGDSRPDLACPDAGDVDDSGKMSLVDVLLLLNYVFSQGSPPASPFPNRGTDPTPDVLWCEG